MSNANNLRLELLPVPAQRIAFALRHPGNTELFRELAKQLCEKFLFGRRPSVAVQDFMSLCYTIDDIKIKSIGRAATTLFSNHLMRMIAVEYAKIAPAVTLKEVEDLKENAGSYADASYLGSWIYPKLMVLASELERRILTQEFAAGIEVSEVTMTLLRKAVGDIGEVVDQIYAELGYLRRYGLKTCYFRDGMLHVPNNVWTFIDPELFSREFQTLAVPPLALTTMAEERDVKNAVDLEGYEVIQRGGGTVRKANYGAASFAASIDQRGYLDYTLGFEPDSVGREFRKLGKYDVYQVLRFVQATRLFDLLVPVQVAAKMPQAKPPGLIRGLAQKLAKGRKVELTPELVVPRIRLLHNVDQLGRELEREVEQGEEETQRRTKREHKVVWHVRQLPPGKHASQEARQRALEQSVVLADNETFVRAHKRGKGDPVAIHRATRRDGSPTI